MAKQLNIHLGITADVTQAKQNLIDLQHSLNQIASTQTTIGGGKMASDLQQAVSAAKSLQQHLSGAMNTTTGNIDLSKLQHSLRVSNESLSTLSSKLLGAGMAGEQSFLQIHKAISTANISFNKADGLLARFGTTLKNTARWQLSSSMLHGFIGAIQEAYGYSQKLNASLNDIRIVTGASAEEMAIFAEQANKSARALSTTTQEFVKGSLIYFQQGLSTEEVQKRTEITVKLAQVSRQTAEETSDQLTAIWNNFYDGSKSLEYYADVLTKLGATTASSTDEIAGGLEKFAAIGETIGLSYEYAAAALATITANTRQSEDVVGTALKTIFARIQGLKLGETLDDGVSLNKYSKALQSVGISIFEQNGELKAMDNILSEMGAKWESLSRAQQTALAQTVAGVRQYNQLMSLMAEWDSGDTDSMIANLKTVQEAEGSLNEQHDIYAEGWEAARNRVKVAFEGIYKAMVPDKEFTDVFNLIGKLVESIGTIINTIGGLGGVLQLAASALMTHFQPSLVRGFDSAIEKVRMFKGEVSNLFSKEGREKSSVMAALSGAAFMATGGKYGGQLAEQKYNSDVTQGTTTLSKDYTASLNEAANSNVILTAGFSSQIDSLQKINDLSNQIAVNRKNLTVSEQENLSAQLKQAQAISEQLAAEKDKLEIIQQQQRVLEDRARDRFYGDSPVQARRNSVDINGEKYSHSLTYGSNQEARQAALFARNNLGMTKKEVGWGSQNTGTAGQMMFGSDSAAEETQSRTLELLKQQAKYRTDIRAIQDDTVKRGGDMAAAIKEYNSQVKTTLPGMKTLMTAVENAGKDTDAINRAMSTTVVQTKNFARNFGITNGEIREAQNNGIALSNATRSCAAHGREFNNILDNVSSGLNKALSSAVGFGNALMTTINTANRIAMSINMIQNAINTIKSPDVSWAQKLVSGTMAASMAIGTVVSIVSSLSNAYKALTAVQLANNAVNGITMVMNKTMAADDAKTAIIKSVLIAARQKEKGMSEKLVLAKAAESIATKTGMSTDKAASLAALLLSGVKDKVSISTINNANAETFNTTATNAGTAANWSYVASMLARYWYIGLIIAAIATLIAVITMLVKADKEASAEANLKKKQELAKSLREEADSAKEAADKLRDTFKSYNEARDKLKECAQGTKEWNEALREANDLAVELLTNLPSGWSGEQIRNSYSRDENGAIVLNEEAMQAAQTQLDARANAAEYAAARAQLDADKASFQVDAVNTLRQNNIQGQMQAEDIAYVATKAIAGDFVNAAVVAIAKSGGSYENMNEAGSNFIAAADSIVNYAGDLEGFRELLSDSGLTHLGDIDTVDEMIKLQEEAAKLSASFEGVAAKADLLAAQLVEDTLGDSYNKETKGLVSSTQEERTEKYKQEYLSSLTDRAQGNQSSQIFGANLGKTTSNNAESAVNILAEVNKYLGGGFSWKVGDGNGIQGSDNNRTFHFLKDGEEKTYSAEQLASELAAAKALQDMTKSAEKAEAMLSKLGDTRIGNSLKNFYAEGNLMKGWTRDDLNQLTAWWADDKDEAWKWDKGGVTRKDAKEYLKQAYNTDDAGLEEIAKAMGTTVDQMADDLAAAGNSAISSLREIRNNLPEAIKSTFEGLSEGLDIEQHKGLKNILSAIYLEDGEEGLSGFEEALEGTGDKSQEVIKELSSIDWSTITPNELITKLRDVGLTSEEISAFDLPMLIEGMKKFSNTAAEAGEQIAAALKEISGNLSEGSHISQEEYDQLIGAGIAADAYFQKMYDGTYKLMADASELQAIINEVSLKPLRDEYEDTIAHINNARVFLDLDEKMISGESLAGTYTTYENTDEGQIIETHRQASILQAQTQTLLNAGVINQETAEKWNNMNWDNTDENTEQEWTKLSNEYSKFIYTLKIDLIAGLGDVSEETLNNWKLDPLKYGNEISQAFNKANISAEKIEEYLQESARRAAEIQMAITEAEFEQDIDRFGLELEKSTVYAEDLVEEFKAMDKAARKTEKSMVDYDRMAKKAAIANQRLDRGLADINDNLEDYNKKLKINNKGTAEYSETMSQFKDSVADIVNVSDGDMLSNSFAQSLLNGGKYAETFKKALDGDTDAILTLKMAAAEDIVLSIQTNLQGSGAINDLETFKNAWQQTKDFLAQNKILSPEVDQTDLINSLNAMIEAGSMTKEQIESVLSELHISANIKTDYVEQEVTVPVQSEYSEASIVSEAEYEEDENGKKTLTKPATWKRKTWVVNEKPATAIGYVPQYTIEGTEGDGTVSTGGITNLPAPKPSSGSTTSGSSSGGGGGSKSKSKAPKKGAPTRSEKVDPTKQKMIKDEIERYQEITAVIADMTRTLESLSASKDRAFGKNKLDAMDREITATKELIKYNKEYLNQVQANLTKDKQLAASYGAAFDSDGRIKNKTALETAWINEYNAQMAIFDAQQQAINDDQAAWENYKTDRAFQVDQQNHQIELSGDENAEQIEVDDSQDYLKEWEFEDRQDALDSQREAYEEAYELKRDALEQYEETDQLYKDLALEIAEKEREIQEMLIDKINYEVDIKIEFRDIEKEWKDYQISLLEDDFTKAAEAVELLKSKFPGVLEDMKLAYETVKKTKEAYEAGQLTYDDYMTSVKENLPDMIDALAVMNDLDKEMLEYYNNQADLWNEAFQEQYDFIGRSTDKLATYIDLLDLLGQGRDFKKINTLLQGQYKTIQDSLSASTSMRDFWQNEYNLLNNKLINEGSSLSEIELKGLEERLQVARENLYEYEELVLQDLTAAGEMANAILENAIAEANDTLQRDLFSGKLASDYMNELDRLNAKQEEYLTNTNKMYETNKLIRKAQQDMDKTDNKRAKQQYDDYVKYIEQLQTSGQLSKQDLQIAQAKYEVLQAEIALEEAKDAKNQVRLTRDSEGNFGYVYTANQDAISSAEQALEDANNRMYNIGLEGAQNYQNLMLQNRQAYEEAMQELEERRLAGEFKTQAEYEAEKTAIIEHHRSMESILLEQYHTAANLLEDESYTKRKDYILMGIEDLGDFDEATKDYLNTSNLAWDEHEQKIAYVEENAKLPEIKTKVGEVTTETDKLTKKISNELVPAFQTQADHVRGTISNYESLRTTLQGVVSDYSQLITLSQAALKESIYGYSEDYSYNLYQAMTADNNTMSNQSNWVDEDYARYDSFVMQHFRKAGGWDKIDYEDLLANSTDPNDPFDASAYQYIMQVAEILDSDIHEMIETYMLQPGAKITDAYAQRLLNYRQLKIDLTGNNGGVKNTDIIEYYKSIGKYDTGGYTGAWGPEGKLAILHEKELVLNAEDTQNWLAGLDIMREITQILDQNAVLASLSALSLGAMTVSTAAADVLQQEVHIDATFPNVTDHNEIELAINDLINAASQYAYK